MIDLHMHTNHSDGSYSPETVVKLAADHGVRILGITDHDEISGVPAAKQTADDLGLTVIAGVELSVEYTLPPNGHFHLIGLFIDVKNRALNEKLDWLREARRHRAHEIIGKLNKIGISLSPNDLSKEMGHGSIGRPHIAELLIKQQIVKNAPQAFSRFLRKGAPAYVSKQKLKPDQAIGVIHNAGGLAIMAHPYTLGFKSYPELGREILKLKEMGLDGIEAYYSSQDRYVIKWLLDFAREHNMAVSGGSDYHGKARPDISPGSGKGNLNIPDAVYDQLLNHYNEKMNK